MPRSLLPERRNGAYLARNWKFESISLPAASQERTLGRGRNRGVLPRGPPEGCSLEARRLTRLGRDSCPQATADFGTQTRHRPDRLSRGSSTRSQNQFGPRARWNGKLSRTKRAEPRQSTHWLMHPRVRLPARQRSANFHTAYRPWAVPRVESSGVAAIRIDIAAGSV
jgi:hypothetical protein